jgi:enediyne biosynthesis protein E4
VNAKIWILVVACATSLSGSAAQPPAKVRETVLGVPAIGKAGFTFLNPDRTGLTFTNELSDWASAENRVLNNGSGVAAGDFDNDGQTDLFFCSLNNRNRLFKNLGDWRFIDVTAQAGLNFAPGYYRAALFADLNGDGSLDLLVGTVGRGVICFLNDGAGRFTDVTSQAGTTTQYATESLAVADIDGNGTLDLYVTNNRTDDIRDWPRIPVVLVNKKPTVPPSLRDRLTFTEGGLQEFGEPHLLYLNDGQARFRPVPWTEGHFLDDQGRPLSGAPLDWGLTAAFRDLNDDGAPDLYVCNDYWTPDRIWLNTGNGRLRAIDGPAIRKISASSMGVDFTDVNHDGHLDIFVVDMLSRSAELRKRQIVAKRATPPRIGDLETRVQTPQNTLLLNRGDGTYAEIACLAGLQASDWSWSPVFLDVDLDGHDDLLITAGHLRDIQDLDATAKIKSLGENWRRAAQGDLQRAFTEAKREHTKFYPLLQMPVVAFRNLGNLRFAETTTQWGLGQLAVNHGMALADFDQDGDLDVVVNRLGAGAGLYRNESAAPRVAVRLRGRAPNTQAIGARVELVNGPVLNHKTEIVAGGSYLSGNDTLRVFAAGSKPHPGLRVRWRNGTVTEISGVKPNHVYEIDENSVAASPPERATLRKVEPLFEDVSGWLQHTHHEDPFNDFERQPLLPRKLSQNGPGVTWFDVNADGWDDLIIGSGKGGPSALFINTNGKGFKRAPDEVAVPRDQTTILAFRQGSNTHLLGGSASYENDTNAPCVVQSVIKPSLQGQASTHNPFPAHSASVGPMALADIDGDGDLDLFAGGQVIPGRYPEAASSLIFRQENGQWAHDAANSNSLRGIGLVNGAVWSNLDDDPLPELVLTCEWGPVRVLQNRRGVLQDMTAAWGLAAFTGLWTGVTTGDFDEDGVLDIVAGNWGLNSCNSASAQKPLVLFYGDFTGLGRLDIIETEFDGEKLAPRLQRDALGAALPFVFENFPSHTAFSRCAVTELLGERMNNARRLSVTTLATTLFLNRRGRFEARALPDEAQFAPAFSAQVADVDGDGHEDIILSQNFFAFAREESRLDAGRGLVLSGDGSGHFKPLPLSGIQIHGEQRGAAVADFDNDGRVDLVVAQNGAATKLYRNRHGDPGLRVRLSGSPGNTDAVGAVLRPRYGDVPGAGRQIHCGSGYWSQNSMVQVFGGSRRPTHVAVRWPNGKETDVRVPADASELTISQP